MLSAGRPIDEKVGWRRDRIFRFTRKFREKDRYCTSKAAGQMLTKCLALEWAEYGIRVNAVCPGAIFTSKSKEPHNAEITEIMNRAIPAGRHGDVREIAEIVAFLASDAASYVTGSSLYADGGYRLATIPYDPRPLRNE